MIRLGIIRDTRPPRAPARSGPTAARPRRMPRAPWVALALLCAGLVAAADARPPAPPATWAATLAVGALCALVAAAPVALVAGMLAAARRRSEVPPQ